MTRGKFCSGLGVFRDVYQKVVWYIKGNDESVGEIRLTASREYALACENMARMNRQPFVLIRQLDIFK